MFVVLQHSFADLRGFDPDQCHRLARPAWPLRLSDSDFVRSSGMLLSRRLGGVAEWEGEDLYCDASMALRFPDSVGALRLGAPALPMQCRFSFRRFYSQGTTARVEVGLRLSSAPDAVLPPDAPALRLEALFAWLSLKVAVGPRKQRGAPLRLIDAGPPLATHFLRASTLRPQPPLPPQPPTAAWWFRASMPSVIVETSATEAMALPPHTRAVAIPPELGTLHHAWLQLGPRRVSVWFLCRREGADAAALRRLRIHLLRLHAEREALREVLAAVMVHKLDIAKDPVLSDAVQRYLNEAIRALDRPARHGVAQAEMIDVARGVFADLFAGETTSLDTMRRQIGQKIQSLVERAKALTTTVNNYHYHGDYMSTTITMGNVTVTGDFNVVTAKSIENSFNKASSTSDPAMADALKALSTQVAELVRQLPPDKREEAARDLEALTTEAAAKAPRRAWYSLSAQGLLDAAKAVAGMAGPVGTAVKAVLDLLPP